FKSKRMIKSVLFKKPPDATDVLANIIVKELGWNKVWGKNKRTQKLFPFPQNGNLTPIQDSLLREVYDYILKKQLSISRSDPKLNTYILRTTSTNEIFACYLTKYLMDETAAFYIETKTSIAKQSLKLLQKETDSLRALLGGSIVSTASEADRTFALNPAMQVQRSSAQNGQVRTTVLATAYGEMVKNLELAKINLQKENPLYQIIDTPEMPLVVSKSSIKLSFILGFGIGVLIFGFGLLALRLIKSFDI
ncbi:MAG: hypothetical protein JWQ09_5331, partial [Segetibacter sp.]|nr:hypothetical protein [Segetibacter sp.]